MASAERVIRSIPPVTWNRLRLRSILASFAGKRILVVGDVGVDRYTIGSVSRISPEAPVPIVLVQHESLKLGLAANVADNVQALGGIPLLTGTVGRDRTLDDFQSLLRKNKIGPEHLVVDRTRRTSLKERIIGESQQVVRVDYESRHELSPEVERRVLAKIKSLIRRADAVVLEDYAKGLVTPRIAERLFAIAKAAGKWVAVDPHISTPLKTYRGAWLLTPNHHEAERLSGITIRDEASLLEAGRKILRTTAAKHVVITRGKDGMAIFTAGSRKVQFIPTYAREVFDVSGAGDTVIAVLALAKASGASIEESVVLGNLAAGVEVGKRGTATVSPSEVREAMDFFGSKLS